MQKSLAPQELARRMLVSCGVLALAAGFIVSLTLIAAAILILTGV